jgi:hypothetical protein
VGTEGGSLTSARKFNAMPAEGDAVIGDKVHDDADEPIDSDSMVWLPILFSHIWAYLSFAVLSRPFYHPHHPSNMVLATHYSQRSPAELHPLCSERGYGFWDGIIVDNQENEQGEEWKRIVVPTQRRTGLLKLSHSSMRGGRFSVGKWN